MKASLYLRVSTSDQIENYSLEAQKERLEAYCKVKGWDVYNVYTDGGYSGATLDRPALQQMLSDLKHIDVVLVYKLDRLSRSQKGTLTLIEEHFLKNNVDFVSITETLDTSTPFGRAMIGILSVFAQLERETIVERMRIGKIKRAENGLHNLGGDYDPAGYTRQDGQLIVNKEEAEHIQKAFDLYEQYHSIAKVQIHLKKEYKVWRFRRYRNILRNKLYCGYVSFSGDYYKGQHEAIISEDQYERVQVLLERHKGHNAHKAKESLFSGLVVCGKCGELFHTYQTLKNNKKVVYRYYICKARRRPSDYDEKCLNSTWNSDKLEKLVIESIKNLSIGKESNEKEEKQINYTGMIKKVDEKIERVLSLFSDGSIEKYLLNKQMSKLDEEKRSIVDAKLRQESKHKETISKEMLDKYAIDLTHVEFNEKQAIIHKLIDNIVINGDSISIEWLI